MCLALAGAAHASTLTQNVSWTIDRAGTTAKYRVDGVRRLDLRRLPRLALERREARRAVGRRRVPLASSGTPTSRSIRRTKSGAVASDIYNNKIVAERSYMQTTNTRIVTFEMCGNDGLQARSSFAGQSGTCNSGAAQHRARATARPTSQTAMNYINNNAYGGTKLKVVVEPLLPRLRRRQRAQQLHRSAAGSSRTSRASSCRYIAKMNWRACNFADTYGFACADSFAQYMGADYDSNGDGQIDSDALRYVQGESEAAYVTRITTTLRSTIRDANTHFVNASTSYDYIQSDNTHPTYTGATVCVGIFGGTGSGSGAPDYSGAQIVGGKNPVWNQLGHERMGWALSVFNPATP